MFANNTAEGDVSTIMFFHMILEGSNVFIINDTKTLLMGEY